MTEITEEELRTCLYAGDVKQTIALLEPRPTAELKRFQKMLAKIRTEHGLTGRGWNTSSDLPDTLIVAGVLCSDTPAQAEGWLRRETLSRFAIGKLDLADLLDGRHDAAWLGGLALRLAPKLRVNNDMPYWHFVNDLAIRGEVSLPLTPAYVFGWLASIGHARWETQERRGERFMLIDWLRKQPRLRECMEALFTTDGAGIELAEYVAGYQRVDGSSWPKAFTTLIAEGLLDRAEVLESCCARLLRGDKPGSLRGILDVYEELAPTPTEVRELLGTFQGMAASGAGSVAKAALRELRALDAEEPFEPMDLASLSEDILARPESGLAIGQLVWLDAALKRDPGAVEVLLPCFGAALTHPATSVQQRALKLLGKRLKSAGSETVSGLRDAALSVDPALKAESDALFAAFITPEPADAAIPAPTLPAYQPPALPPLPGTPEELVTALAPSLTRGEISPLEAEQIMAATAILAHRDRAGLAEVFRPLYDRHAGSAHQFYTGELWRFPNALRCLLHAVVGEDHRGRNTRLRGGADMVQPHASFALRIQELTDWILRHKTVPVLLATPTEASGTIDPAVFESRMAVYRELGIKPLPLDLAHARLRVAADPSRTWALDEIPIAESDAPGTKVLPRAEMRRAKWGDHRALRIHSVLLVPDHFQEDTFGLPQPDPWNMEAQPHFMSIMVPHDPDLAAACALTDLYYQANDSNSHNVGTSVFPSLAETAGVPGQLTHLALVYALAANTLAHRIAGQDAVLILASRGLLRPGRLGRFAAVAWQRDMVRGKRIVDGLGRVEESGASAEVFRTAAAMLEPLSKTPEIRGLPEVLLLATRAAVGAGIRGVPDAQLPGLAELAALSTPKRVGVEARRLCEAIATPA